MGEICSFNERNDRYKGNLLRVIDNCLGAALKGVKLLWTISFTNKFSLFQLLQTMLAIYVLLFLEKKLYIKNAIPNHFAML